MGKYDELLSAAVSEQPTPSKYSDLLAAVSPAAAPQDQSSQVPQNSTVNPSDDPYGFQAAKAYGQQQGLSPQDIEPPPETQRMFDALSKWSTEPIGGGAPVSPQQPDQPVRNILRALYNPVAQGYNFMLEPRNVALTAATLFPPTSEAGLAGFAAEMTPSAVPIAKQAYEAGKQAVGIPVEHPMTFPESLEAGTNL